MNQTVEMPRRFLYRFPHIIIAIEVEHICNQIERVLIVLNLGVQAGQIEAVGKVVFIDLAKVLVSPRRYELSMASDVSKKALAKKAY